MSRRSISSNNPIRKPKPPLFFISLQGTRLASNASGVLQTEGLKNKEKEKRSWPTYLLLIKTKPMAMGSSSAKHRCFTRRCSRLVKEQKARLYILRQCATMLVCWYIHGED
ncbi:hypothetical protein EJ110_NYTH30564 [Nymphaea thermarum]|nr:hypothetical protein EJ110_NYTH30564 [Nymphaea thermarum]